MGEPQTLSQKLGLTRGKAALIGVLAVALTGVVYFQYGSSEGDEALAEAVYTPPVPYTPPVSYTAPTVSVPSTEPASTVEVPQPRDDAVLAAAFDQTRWKSPDLTQVVAYDPFALPSAFPRPVQTVGGMEVAADGSAEASDSESQAAQLAEAIAQLQTELESLQQRGVQVIVRQRDQYVALIGNRTVHVGDVVEGFKVIAIEPDGVRVERKINP